MSDPTLRPVFYVITGPDFQDYGDCGEDREEKVIERLEYWNGGILMDRRWTVKKSSGSAGSLPRRETLPCHRELRPDDIFSPPRCGQFPNPICDLY